MNIKPIHKQPRIVEFLLLFVLYPVFLGINSISLYIRLSFAPLIIIYLGFICFQNKNSLFKKRNPVKPHNFWTTTLLRLSIIAIASIGFVVYTNKELLFSPVLTKPLLWITMILVYTLFSVLPQEFIYRTFYFQRYRSLFKNQHLFFFANALTFSLAHLMFESTLVLAITFIGGYLFAYTYQKTTSFVWVSVEHILYGSWLFTVGMGKMIGFPL